MSERDETREAVARAILTGFDSLQQDFDALFPQVQDVFRSAADAALKAMSPGSRFTVEGVECVVVAVPSSSLDNENARAKRDGFSSKLEWLRAYRRQTNAPLREAMIAYDHETGYMLRACEEKGDG